MVWGLGFTGSGIRGSGFRVYGLGFRLEEGVYSCRGLTSLRVWVQGSETFRVQSGFRV
jgi:hypothetical protein